MNTNECLSGRNCSYIVRLSVRDLYGQTAPRFEEIKLASCQLELPPQKGLETNQLELEKSLTRVSKPKKDTYDQEQIDKLSSKLDLSGCDSWSEKQKQMV